MTEKVARNVDAIFELHAAALDWLEDYTRVLTTRIRNSVSRSSRRFSMAVWNMSARFNTGQTACFSTNQPSDTQLLGRAGLISHETAHMWFGNLVTMEWFNDVWMKEVFANFMAAKIVNPGFPDINHDLNFLVRHYPSAYSVDRTSGANPIRQYLAKPE